MFVDEASCIVLALEEELVDIHHIGSTAVPYMPSRPIIDILTVVQTLEIGEQYDRALATLGYEAAGHFGVSSRRFYARNDQGVRGFHVHVFEIGDPEIQRHTGFRDFLIGHAEDAKAYALLKHALSNHYSDDPESYTNAKSAFIQQTEKRVRAWQDSLEQA